MDMNTHMFSKHNTRYILYAFLIILSFVGIDRCCFCDELSTDSTNKTLVNALQEQNKAKKDLYDKYNIIFDGVYDAQSGQYDNKTIYRLGEYLKDVHAYLYDMHSIYYNYLDTHNSNTHQKNEKILNLLYANLLETNAIIENINSIMRPSFDNIIDNIISADDDIHPSSLITLRKYVLINNAEWKHCEGIMDKIISKKIIREYPDHYLTLMCDMSLHQYKHGANDLSRMYYMDALKYYIENKEGFDASKYSPTILSYVSFKLMKAGVISEKYIQDNFKKNYYKDIDNIIKHNIRLYLANNYKSKLGSYMFYKGGWAGGITLNKMLDYRVVKYIVKLLGLKDDSIIQKKGMLPPGIGP